jgi:hypothetical protein
VSEVVVSGRRLPLSRALVQRVVQAVLRSERRDAPVLPSWREGLHAYLETGVTT